METQNQNVGGMAPRNKSIRGGPRNKWVGGFRNISKYVWGKSAKNNKYGRGSADFSTLYFLI